MGALPTFASLPREWSKWSRFTSFVGRPLYSWAAGRSRSHIEARWAFWLSVDRAAHAFAVACARRAA